MDVHLADPSEREAGNHRNGTSPKTVYAVVFFDALRVKIRDEGLVRNKAVYLAIGITCGGEKDVLGLWVEQSEGLELRVGVRGQGQQSTPL